METPKEFETPKGLSDCTLTDISLLREWLASVCDPQRYEANLFHENKEALEGAGFDKLVARAVAAFKAFIQEKVVPESLKVKVLDPRSNDESSSEQRAAA